MHVHLSYLFMFKENAIITNSCTICELIDSDDYPLVIYLFFDVEEYLLLALLVAGKKYVTDISHMDFINKDVMITKEWKRTI